MLEGITRVVLALGMMNWLKQLFSRRRLYDDLDQKIALHMELRIENLATSMFSGRGGGRASPQRETKDRTLKPALPIH